MKKVIFSSFFIFTSLFLFAQYHRLTLRVKTDDKITIHGFCYWQELQVRSKDTSFAQRLHSGNPDVIHYLKPGAYLLTAVSIFNHRVTKKIELTKKTPLIKINGLETFYTRLHETKNLSEKVKLNDTLYIIYSKASDESVKEKIGITKTKSGYVAIQYLGLSTGVFQTMSFKEEKYRSVVKFESESKKANSPKAETAPRAEVFTFELNKEISSFIIAGENEGFEGLKAMLFANK